MAEWTTVAKVGEIVPGKWLVADVDGAQIIVINYKDEYFAVEDVCSHDGGKLTGGWMEGDQIMCPRHGSAFCIRTGKALTPPAYDPATIFPVRVQAGEIQVKDDRWD